MSNISKSGAVLFAKDPQHLAQFYTAIAGLKATHSGPDVIVLESPGQQLIVHPIPARLARGIDITIPPKRRTQAAVKQVFAVKSIAAARERAAAFGGELNPPERMFEARGFRACDGHDPEGNVIQCREPAAAPATRAAAPRAKASRKAGVVDFATVRELALALPDVVDHSTLRGMGFKARGKLLACKAIHRSAEPDTLMVRVATADRDRLIGTDPAVFYLTPHYVEYSSVLVRLNRVGRKTLQDVLGAAWQFVTTGNTKGGRKPGRRRQTASVFRYL